MKREGVLQDEIIQFLVDRNIWYLNLLAGTTRAGIPDILVCHGGWFIGLELKRPGGAYKPTFVQKRNLKEITENGGLAAVVYSVQFVEKLFDCIDRNDGDGLRTLGWRTKGDKELYDRTWSEEGLW